MGTLTKKIARQPVPAMFRSIRPPPVTGPRIVASPMVAP